ncbi:Uncharacterised protein [Mycobacteroides abscessus subsp. massiliense]|nr:Uncharacterised protein [Mycobacteroides abscessus subsp. massiliense]
MYLERLVDRPLLLAELVQRGQQLIQVLGAAAVHPTVAPGRASQRRIGMAADEDRDGCCGRGAHLGLGNVVELTVELEVVAGGKSLDDLDALVHTLAALGEWHIHQLIVLGPGAGAHAQAKAVTRQRRDGRGLLGHQRRRADRQLENEDVEPQRRGHGTKGRGEGQRFDKRFALEEFTVPVGRIRIFRVRLIGIRQAVGDGHAVISSGLGSLGQWDVVRGVGHRLGEGEPHRFLLECPIGEHRCCPYYAL